MIYLVTFVCGALYEITSVYWVISTEKLRPLHAAFWSFLQALVMLTGIGESIKDIKVGIAFVFGYSIGSAVGILIEKRRARSRPDGAGNEQKE